MNWVNQAATENQAGPADRLPQSPVPELNQITPATGTLPDIQVGKTASFLDANGKTLEVFTMSIGAETIHLLPLKTWAQLDLYKWRVRGKLPATPAGLEITPDHVKVIGETVRTDDPEGAAKLEKILNDWLALERETLALARKKAQARPATQQAEISHELENAPLHFQVQLDKERQVHISCIQGKETLATIGLNPAGFNSLVSQGFLRKPHRLQVGALHDWIELDGTLYSFEKGNNDAAKLEQVLNEHYLAASGLGQGRDIVVFANAASSTGFDIQFPLTVAGVRDNRKRPLNEESLEVLQDPDRCGLLHKTIVVKLSRPNLIFKQKTPDGGEQYLPKCPENVVTVGADEGTQKSIDLSQPVNYLHLGPVELTAVLNHPAINRHVRSAPPALPPTPKPKQTTHPETMPDVPAAIANAVHSSAQSDAPQVELAAPTAQPRSAEVGLPSSAETEGVSVRSTPDHLAGNGCPAGSPISGGLTTPEAADPDVLVSTQEVHFERLAERPQPAKAPESPPVPLPKLSPNAWLKPMLSQEPIRHDWFACLVYAKMAERLGNSRQGQLGISACWAIALGETEDLEDAAFKGVFLTEKGGLGFLNRGHITRFNKGVAFLGTQESALEGIDVRLLAVGLDLEQRIVFILSDNYRSKFGVASQAVARELEILKQHGAVILSVPELLQSQEPLEVVWTAPAVQENFADPQALEHERPSEASSST